MSDSNNKIYPLMPLRDIVVFPHMVAPLVVGRQKSIKALENVMTQKTEIFLVTQQDAKDNRHGWYVQLAQKPAFCIRKLCGVIRKPSGERIIRT